MKRKVLVVMLAVIMAVSALLPCAAAGDEMTVTCAKVEGNPGKEVTVTVTCENNPGFYALSLGLVYDHDVLEYVGCTNLMTDMTLNAEKSFVWDSTELHAGDGAMMEVTFRIAGNAPEDEYPISVTVFDGTTENAEGEWVLFYPVGVAGSVSVVPEKGGEFVGANLELGASLTMRYYAKTVAGATVRFTMAGLVASVEGVPTEEEGVFEFSFENIAPQQMGDIIKAHLVVNGKVEDKKEDYSVLSYCKSMKNKTAAELKMTQAKFGKMLTLIDDLLEYGAAAQAYMNYNTDQPVNVNAVNQSRFEELDSEYYGYYVDGEGKNGVCFSAAGVNHANANRLYFKFYAPGVTNANFQVKVSDVNGESTTYSLDELTLLDEATSLYELRTEPILATEFDNWVTVELQIKPNRSWSTVQSLDYGITAYICSKQNSSNASLRGLVRSMFCYGASAVAYQG